MKLDRVIAVRNQKIVYRDGDSRLKVFSEWYSKADIFNEALNTARIEETGIKTPKLLEVTSIDGKWAIVFEYIKGKTLDMLLAENPQQKSSYLEKLVDLQLGVQSYRCPKLRQLKDKMEEKISLSGLDETTRYELSSRLYGMETHEKICHGDFTPANIIVGEDGLDYIIDWSHTTKGNASADVARTYLMFRLNGDAEGAEEYLDLFCSKSGTPKQYVRKWIPIVAAAQLSDSNEMERAFLLHWVNIVD